MKFDRPLRLTCPIQRYDWGKRGPESLVARLAGCSDDPRPAAELWMGAHPSAPATTIIDGKEWRLDELIKAYPKEILGVQTVAKFGPTLPFLFKVLSIRTALSLQTHPDKQTAEKLHREDPKHYPDANHKPEIAIAVTPLELLYGFRPLTEIEHDLKRLPILREIFCETDSSSVRTMFTRVMTATKSQLQSWTKQLIQSIEQTTKKTSHDGLVQELAPQYVTGDPGIFCIYLLNYLKLSPGQAIFTTPGVLHSYLRGDIVECMANSDNVVRGGLTSKYCDNQRLAEIVDFNSCAIQIITAKQAEGNKNIYITPANEFEIQTISQTNGTYSREVSKTRIVICTAGTALIRGSFGDDSLAAGNVSLIPAGCFVSEISATKGVVFIAEVA